MLLGPIRGHEAARHPIAPHCACLNRSAGADDLPTDTPPTHRLMTRFLLLLSLALPGAVDIQRDVHRARDRRRRAALAGLDLRGVAHVENDWVVQVREDLGVRDGVVGGEAEREQAPGAAAWLRREGGEGADDTHRSGRSSVKFLLGCSLMRPCVSC